MRVSSPKHMFTPLDIKMNHRNYTHFQNVRLIMKKMKFIKLSPVLLFRLMPDQNLELKAYPRVLPVFLTAVLFNPLAFSCGFTWLVTFHSKPGVLAHACNHSTQKVEAEGLRFGD